MDKEASHDNVVEIVGGKNVADGSYPQSPDTSKQPSHYIHDNIDIINSKILTSAKTALESSPGTVVEFPTQFNVRQVDYCLHGSENIANEETAIFTGGNDFALAAFGDMFFDIFQSESADDHDTARQQKEEVTANKNEDNQDREEIQPKEFYCSPPTQDSVEEELAQLTNSAVSNVDAAQALHILQCWYLHSTNVLQELIKMNVVPTLLMFLKNNMNDSVTVEKVVKFIQKCICLYDDDPNDQEDVEILATVLAIQFVQSRGMEIFMSALAVNQNEYFPCQPCLFKTILDALINIVEKYPCTIELLQHHEECEDDRLRLLEVVEICFERIGHVMTTRYMASILQILNVLLRVPFGREKMIAKLFAENDFGILDGPKLLAKKDFLPRYSPDRMIRRELLRKHLPQKCTQILETNQCLHRNVSVMESATTFFYRCMTDCDDKLAQSLGHADVLPLISHAMKSFRYNGIIQGGGCVIIRYLYLDDLNGKQNISNHQMLGQKKDGRTIFEDFVSFFTDSCCPC